MNLYQLATLFSATDGAATDATGMGIWPTVLITLLMVAVLYFVMWRPQRKKEKKEKEMRSSMEVGDEVTTIGGIVGRVVSLKEDTFVLETAGDRSRMRFKRWAIQSVGKLDMEDGTEGDSIKNDKMKTDKPSKSEK